MTFVTPLHTFAVKLTLIVRALCFVEEAKRYSRQLLRRLVPENDEYCSEKHCLRSAMSLSWPGLVTW